MTSIVLDSLKRLRVYLAFPALLVPAHVRLALALAAQRGRQLRIAHHVQVDRLIEYRNKN